MKEAQSMPGAQFLAPAFGVRQSFLPLCLPCLASSDMASIAHMLHVKLHVTYSLALELALHKFLGL